MTDEELVQFKNNFEQIFSIKKFKSVTKKKDYSYYRNLGESETFEYYIEVESFVDPLNRNVVSEVIAVYGELLYDLKLSRWFDTGETFIAQSFDYNPEAIVVDIPINQLDLNNWIAGYTEILDTNINKFSFPIELTTKNGRQFEYQFPIEENIKLR